MVDNLVERPYGIPHPRFPQYYVICIDGKVWSRHINRFLSSNINSNGYVTVTVTSKKGISTLAHRLVAETFLPNPKNLPQVNHKNGIKNDNRVSNLEWVSSLDNNLHSINVLNRKLSCRRVRGVSLKDDTVVEYKSIMDAAKDNNVGYKAIGKNLNGKTKSSKGFSWSYIDNLHKVEIEGWKTIEEYPIYVVSKNGEVAHKKNKTILKPSLSYGYLMASLYTNNKGRRISIHRLVAFTYLGSPPSKKYVVNHKDGNKLNNNVSNLEWVTQSENIKHAYDSGLKPHHNLDKKILCITKEGKYIVYDSVKGTGIELDIPIATLYGCLSGRNKTCRGMKWIYISKEESKKYLTEK